MSSSRDAFHEGEILVQERTGERAVGQRNGAMIASRIVPGARTFLAAQRMIVAATIDPDDHLWASLWFGSPGFVRSDEAGASVRLAPTGEGISPDDPVAPWLQPSQPVGLLAIELASRRRLRVNGVVRARDGQTMDVDVQEAFPNCPKYIQRRELSDRSRAGGAAPTARGETLDALRVDRVARADTAFVASRHPDRGVDASHRGGAPGFIQVTGARTLRIPDYPGNSMFQTLGNLSVDPRAALSVVDFDQGRLLALTGQASLTFGVEDPDHPTGGTGRSWTFAVERWIELALPETLGWELVERSRFNPV